MRIFSLVTSLVTHVSVLLLITYIRRRRELSKMGRSSSKLLEAPNNPLQELQFQELKRVRQKRQQQKDQKQIAKLQKKHAKKNKKKQKQKHIESDMELSTMATRSSDPLCLGSSMNFRNMRCDINMEDINRQIESKMQMHLDRDLCTFIINQISLTLQFFGNYESEITNTADELLAQENDFNQNLEEHSILLTNPLDVAVSKWIQYQPFHGPDKNQPQLLHPPTMYVVFENIDVARPNDANYDSISPLCKVDMEIDFYKTTPCNADCASMMRETKWKGFVRLKLRENPKTQKNLNSTGDEVYTDGSSGYSTVSGYSSKAILPSSNSSNSSDLDYDYAYITHLNMHHPLTELKLSNQREKEQLNVKVLPESCVCSLGQFIEPSNELTDEEYEDETDDDSVEDEEAGYNTSNETATESRKDYETIQAIKLYKMEQERRKVLMQQRYLNSKEFMRYFGELLRQELAQKLCIPREDMELGSYRGASVYTKQYEVIPAIHVAQNVQSWPDCAFQFRIRERPITTNPLTGQQFQWPTRSMIKRIETFGFHIIPIGFAPKRQRNPFRELEWRIVFPKAERYLERHLTSTQVKVFMMTKALVKTFLEQREKSSSLMFAMDHLRVHLFWECERNFTAWPEEFLGEVLLRFINSFMQCLRTKNLRDYFIEERNLFESIPEYSLVTLYSILADITANPLMHIMIACRNLHYAENFFPKLNFKKICDNLTDNDVMKLKMLAKNSRSFVDSENVGDEPLLMVDEGAKGLVGMKQHREKTNGRLRRKTQIMRHHIEMKKKEEYDSKRKSIESIDVEFCFNQNKHNEPARLINQGIENLRRTNILEIILDHLLAMAEKALALHTVHLTKLYLSQAQRLCQFYHNYGCDMGAKEYLASIHNISENMAAAQKQGDYMLTPPALPIRASVEPVRPSQLKVGISANVGNFYEKLPQITDLPIAIEMPKPNSTGLVTQQNKRNVSNADLHKSDNSLELPALETSITFIEHVVEVHEGESNAMQASLCHSPISIHRSGGEISRTESRNSVVNTKDESIKNIEEIQRDQEEHVDTAKAAESRNDQVNATKSLMSKFGSAAGILKNTSMVNLKIMKTLTSSTEKMISTMTAEEKRAQIREMLKKKTVQLSGAFNQSSES